MKYKILVVIALFSLTSCVKHTSSTIAYDEDQLAILCHDKSFDIKIDEGLPLPMGLIRVNDEGIGTSKHYIRPGLNLVIYSTPFHTNSHHLNVYY